MAKKKPDSIDSFSGLFKGNDLSETPTAEPTEEPVVTETPEPTPTNNVPEKKSPGRPKVDREKKKQYAISIPPSVYDAAQEKAYKDHKSMSGLITELLADYIENQY